MQSSDERKNRRRRPWRRWFAVISLLLLVICGLLGYQEYTQRIADQGRQQAFLAKFRGSFTSGQRTVAGPATIREIRRLWMPEYGSFRGPGVNEYVVTAQFEENGETKWGRWLYTTNQDAHEMIYKHAFAHASSRSKLPKFPAPLQTYLTEATWKMIDGIPSTAGPSAKLVSINSQVRVNEPLQIRATAPIGTECIVDCFPPDSVLDDPTPISPQPDKSLTWKLKVNPKMAGGGFMVKIRCREQRGEAVFENSIAVSNVHVLPVTTSQIE